MLAECQSIQAVDSADFVEQRTILLTPEWPPRSVDDATCLEDDACLIGECVGRYHVQELIGNGSFGQVYRALDPHLGRDVAIKVADRSIAEDPTSRERFWNEARIQARLEHSNIVPIYDLLEDSDRLMIVMRLIHGEDLDKRLRQMVRPYTPNEMLKLMRHVSSAIGSAHQMGVVHQDLKPANIRLTPSGEPVVMDFGVARITGQAIPAQHTASGTPGYMSPEQIRGEPIDARTDIYALAMTLYKTLTGRHPFEDAGNLDELLAWQLERDPPPPTQFNPQVPDALASTILQGLAKNPRERFRACADFTSAASAALGAQDTVPIQRDDGRWDPRAAVTLDAQVLLDGQPAVDAQVIDLSRTGAALRLSRPLEPGVWARLLIRIPLKASEHLVRCTVRVLRTMPDPDTQGLRTGVAFEQLGDFDRMVLSDLVRAVLTFNHSRCPDS